MEIRFNQPKGLRILNQFHWIDVIEPDNAESLWFEHSSLTWVPRSKWDPKSVHSNHHDVGDKGFPRTFKALLKYLKRHKELKGCKVLAYSRFVGHYIEVQL